MKSTLLFSCVLCLVCGINNAEYLTRKLCKDVDVSRCSVHNVIMDPCTGEPSFCIIKRNKHYTLSMDFTPRFSAKRLKLAMYGDDANVGVFEKVIKTPGDACDLLTCPVDADMRRLFDVDFVLDKTLPVGKFPVKVKLWNEDDESQACCFTFNIKVHK